MNKKQIVLLITLIFICLISVNVFASQQPYVIYENPNSNSNILEQDLNTRTYQPNTEIENSIIINEQIETKIEEDEALPLKQKTRLLKMKDKSRDMLTKYQEKYKNNVIYGTIAYILNQVRLISIPFFVVGYLISIVYEFIVGMKRREMVRKGRGMRITLVSTFVMAQVLPLVFAVVIKFWGN